MNRQKRGMGNIPQSSRIVLVVIIAASAMLGLFRFNSFQVGAYADDAHYIVLAESLARGYGYRLINFPVAPLEQSFPFGWSLLLAPIAALFPDNLTALKLLAFTFWLISIPLAFRFFAPRIATQYLEMLTALIALNPMVSISGMVMSEAAYLCFSLLALNLFDDWKQRAQKNDLLIILVVVAVYAQLIRAIGISLVLALLLYVIVTRPIRQSALGVLVAVVSMLPQFWLNAQSGGALLSSGYQAQIFANPITSKPAEMWWNVQAYLSEKISGALVPIFGPTITATFDKLGLGNITVILNGLVLVLLALGIALAFRRFQVADLYVTLYSIALLAFLIPGFGGAQDRFLIPLVPFLYFYLIQAIIWLARRIFKSNERRVSVVVLGVIALVVSLSVFRNLQDWQNPIRNRMTDLSIGAEWIRANAPADAVVMTRNPVPAYLYARRKTVAYPKDGQDIEKTIASNGVTYLMITPKLQIPRTNQLEEFTKSNLIPLVSTNSRKYRLMWSDDTAGVSVYQIHSQ